MNRLLLSFALVAGLLTLGLPQIPEKGKRSDEINIKMQRVELALQILPVAMTPDQIKKILPKLEKTRAEQRKIMASEDDELIKIEPKIDATLKAAYEKGEYPSPQALNDIRKVAAILATRRNLEISRMTDELYDELKKSLNAGQLAVMAKTIEAKSLNPAKPEEVTEEARTKAYIRAFLLHPAAYEILVKLSEKKE
ncbi:MAG TPA: hypothetical protein VGE01_03600 [Fimbriimonas sp.]